MSKIGQDLTKLVYEDPEIVEGYIRRNAVVPKNVEMIHDFSRYITGKNVLDLGCGPGQDAYEFANLGFSVIGLDYSQEMIRRARNLKSSANPPNFIEGDMSMLTSIFKENQFDAVWASASLIHIPVNKINQVLTGISTITKNSGVVYIGLKAGEGTEIVSEDKLGKPMKREFIFWNKDKFVEKANMVGWELLLYYSRQGSEFRGKPTEWLNFVFRVRK
jgi:ubiquinone/menaquinone biosynthesis C-methylase UbiE